MVRPQTLPHQRVGWRLKGEEVSPIKGELNIYVYVIVYGGRTTEVVSIRVPKELKEGMRRLRGVNWSELIRRFIEEAVARYEAEEVIRKVERDLKNIP